MNMKYITTFAKVKTWKKDFFKKKDLDDILQMNYNDLVSEIKEKTNKIDITNNSINEIEFSLKQENLNYIKSCLHYLDVEGKNIIKQWSKIYEIENLKIIARSVLRNKPINYLFDVGEKSKLNRSFVKNINTLEDLKDFLLDTEYTKIFNESFTRITEDNSSFYFEINLDNYFASKIKRKLYKLGADERKSVKKTIVLYLELNRILWIYRGRFIYNIPYIDILTLFPNIFNILKDNKYENLAKSETKEVFCNILYEYKILRSKEKIESLEIEFNKIIVKKMKSYITKSPFNLSMVLSFLLLNLINTKNLIIALESKNISIESSLLNNMLIFYK